MREITLLLHFIGLGLLFTTMVGGFLMDRQYRKAPDLRAKALILKAARPFGLLSPIAVLLMLVTGIGNMHAIGVGMYDLGWLSAKLALYAIAVVAGIVLGIFARKRGALVHAMSLGQAQPDAEKRLATYDTLMSAGHFLMLALMIGILYFSVVGRLGGQ